MFERPARPVLPVILAVALVCLMLGAAYAAYELYSRNILPVFAGPYVRARGEALSIAGFAAAYLAAVTLYAGAFSRSRRGDRASSSRLVRISVVAACAYAVLSVLVEPRVVREYESMRRRSEEANGHLRLAGEAKTANDLVGQREHIEAYLAIDPGNGIWRRALDNITGQMAAGTPKAAPPAPAPIKAAEPSAASLVARARAYFAQRDYATAYTLADRAAAIAPASREAAALRAQALDALGRVEPSPADVAKSDLYLVKEQGKKALEAHDPAGAYYILKRASRRWPQDAELLELLGNAEQLLSAFAFFDDTVPDPQKVPPRDRASRVAFVNRREGGLVEIVYADTVARVPRTRDVRVRDDNGLERMIREEFVEVTLYGIEAMAFGGGSVAYHMVAPVGRVQAEPASRERQLLADQIRQVAGRLVPPAAPATPVAQISLLELSRDVQGERREPRFVIGTAARFEGFGLKARVEPGKAGASPLPLMVPVTTVWALGLDVGSVRERDVIELWTLSRATASLAVKVELAVRAVGPFVLLLLGAVAAGVAARHPPAAALPSRTYLLTPAVAAAGYIAFVLSLHIVRVAVVLLADGLGWPAGMTVLAAALLGLLVVSFVWMDRSLRRAV